MWASGRSVFGRCARCRAALTDVQTGGRFVFIVDVVESDSGSSGAPDPHFSPLSFPFEVIVSRAVFKVDETVMTGGVSGCRAGRRRRTGGRVYSSYDLVSQISDSVTRNIKTTKD